MSLLIGRVGAVVHRISVALFAAAALAACAQLPSQAKVKAFGEATTQLTTIFNTSIDVNADLARREGVERDALIYLNQDAKTRGTYNLPPKPARAISKEAL